jgi:uncharacterized membrane protein YpjA
MKRKRIWLHVASVSILSVPNLTYLGLNFDILKEANAIALTMSALMILAVVGVGVLAHIKFNAGVWALLIGIFVLALSNIAYIAGYALLIEGAGLALDGYVFKPLIKKEKIKELKEKGENVVYTDKI